MRIRDGQVFVFATWFALSVAILGSPPPVSARRLNSASLPGVQERPKKELEKPEASTRVNRCGPSRQDQLDLSGRYTGNVDYPDAGLRGNATLTIKENEFWLTVGSVIHSGQITALSFCGQTTATMLFGEAIQRPGQKPPVPLNPLLLTVQQQDDRFILTMDSREAQSFSFLQMKGGVKASSGTEIRAPKDNIPRAISGMASRARLGDRSTSRIAQFPWPPPRASAFVNIPQDLLIRTNTQPTLGIVAERLQKILNQAGYDEMSWYEAPGGFALVSRFEQFDDEGRPVPGAARFLPELFSPPIRGAWDYLTRLILSRKGHFRVIVFLVSSDPFSQRDVPVSPEEAKAWLSGGANGLPVEIQSMPFTREHFATTLIYEFEQASTDSPATLKRPSSLTGMTHLERCQLWKALAAQ